MNLFKNPILNYGFQVITIFLLLFVSIEIDRFTFGMMRVTNSISFGLGVALFCGTNILFACLIFVILKSIYQKD
jgi:hypothetical protein